MLKVFGLDPASIGALHLVGMKHAGMAAHRGFGLRR